MRFRSELARLWDRYDTWVAYAFIAAFALLELATLIFPAVETAVAPQVRLVLLCLGLLAFFRSLDSSVARISARVATPRLSDGIARLLTVERSIGRLIVMANDGSKYYGTISESGGRIRDLRVVLTSDRHLEDWRNLHERGIVDRLEIRLQDGPPAYHLAVVPGRIALFGAFTPRPTGGFASGTTLLFEDGSRELRELIATYERLFDAAWDRAADRVAVLEGA